MSDVRDTPTSTAPASDRLTGRIGPVVRSRDVALTSNTADSGVLVLTKDPATSTSVTGRKRPVLIKLIWFVWSVVCVALSAGFDKQTPNAKVVRNF